MAGKATLSEIEEKWSLCDLMDANEALDIQEELEQEAADEAKRNERKK